MHLHNNTTLQSGKYQIVRFLSSGGFGNTYEGVHTMMDTRVAIKEFFPKMFCNRDENTLHVTVATQGNRELVDKLRKKFNEEAKAVFQMKHDNIVRVLDIFEENGTAYYVMEYIDGKSLNDITKERGALPEAEAVGYIRQVADALKYVHSLNRLHLDIKPGNIMIDKNGKAILIDFGASKHYDDESGENTSTLMGVNTKGYAPIEQSTQSFTSFSPATDIYALGATLYKLLTGIVPPDANLLLAEEEALQPLPYTVSYPTRNAVMAAMQLRRKDRPQSVDEFVAMLAEKQSISTINVSRHLDGKKNVAVDDETIIDSTKQPRFKSANSNKSDQEIKDEALDIAKKYPLGFKEYKEEYEGSLNDVNYCRKIVRDKPLIIRDEQRLSKEHDYNKTSRRVNKETIPYSKSSNECGEDIDILCKFHNLSREKAELLYNENKKVYKSLISIYKNILSQTPADELAEIELKGYYTCSSDFDFSSSLKGRIGRIEYLLTQIGANVGYYLAILYGSSYLSYGVLIIIAYLLWLQIAQGAKRCHDLGKSGWYQLIPFYFIWLLFAPKKKDLNRYGLRL